MPVQELYPFTGLYMGDYVLIIPSHIVINIIIIIIVINIITISVCSRTVSFYRPGCDYKCDYHQAMASHHSTAHPRDLYYLVDTYFYVCIALLAPSGAL